MNREQRKAAKQRLREALERGEMVVLQRMTPEQRRAARRAVNEALERADQQHPSRLDRWDRPADVPGAKGDGVTDDTEALRKRGES